MGAGDLGTTSVRATPPKQARLGALGGTELPIPSIGEGLSGPLLHPPQTGVFLFCGYFLKDFMFLE